MFQVHANKSQQLLTMSFSRHVEQKEMKCCVQTTRTALEEMNPGFSLLTDLSDLEVMDSSCALCLGEIMSLCDGKSISAVARVIPDPHKDIGFNIISQFHYGSKVQTMTYDNLEDAIHSLAA